MRTPPHLKLKISELSCQTPSISSGQPAATLSSGREHKYKLTSAKKIAEPNGVILQTKRDGKETAVDESNCSTSQVALAPVRTADA